MRATPPPPPRLAPAPATTSVAPGRSATTCSLATEAAGGAWEDGDLEGVRRSIVRMLPEALTALPAAIRPGVRDALEKSLDRIRTSLNAGRISREEAEAALEMVREMSEALVDLAGRCLVVVERNDSGVDRNVDVVRLRANDKDELVLVTRREADATGEARISLRMVKDDGEEIPSRYRLGLRLDLERRGSPSVDVQFGESSLDKRIHGLWRYPDGQPVLTATGAQLADHHFRGVLPASLADPTAFGAVVTSFRASTGL